MRVEEEEDAAVRFPHFDLDGEVLDDGGVPGNRRLGWSSGEERERKQWRGKNNRGERAGRRDGPLGLRGSRPSVGQGGTGMATAMAPVPWPRWP